MAGNAGLSDTPRQVLAGGVSGAVFLGLFFGMSLAWWLALVLAAVVYAAALLIIPRRKALTEIQLGARTTAADLEAAGQALLEAASRFETAAGRLDADDAAAVADMARHVRSIRDNVLNDPEDYRLTRRFITSYLPNMVESTEAYANLWSRAQGREPERLAQLGAQIRGFGPVLDEIDRACIENDFAALESEVDALGTQLNRRLPR